MVVGGIAVVATPGVAFDVPIVSATVEVNLLLLKLVLLLVLLSSLSMSMMVLFLPLGSYTELLILRPSVACVRPLPLLLLWPS